MTPLTPIAEALNRFAMALGPTEQF